jgi:dethiobiotin synthetase
MAGLSRGVWQLASEEQGQEAAAGRSRASGVFVTATSTEIGKTVVSAVLARTLADEGKRVAVFKPAVTGMSEFPDYDEAAAIEAVTAAAAGDPADAEAGDCSPSAEGLPDPAVLRVAACSSQTDTEISPYRYDLPMSPHLAAGLAGEEIDPERVMRAARAAAERADAIVCEGVGGLLVPLAPSWTVRSFAVELGYPVVVVSPPGLGAINHALLTVESARSVGLKVAAIVLNPWPEDPTPIELDNRETIAALSGAEVLTLPHLDLSRPDTWPLLRLP